MCCNSGRCAPTWIVGPVLGLGLLLGVSCSSSQVGSEAAAPRAGAAKPLPEGSLGRQAVVAIVDEGLGVFLQRVQVEPSLQDGRFQGFRILALQPENFWRNVDLRAGDVVTAVNGKSVEQPASAFDVFESLRTAQELSVSLIRDGERRQLVFPIVGAPQPKRAPRSEPQSSGPAEEG